MTIYVFTVLLIAIAPAKPGVEPIPASRMYATVRFEHSTLEECEKAKTRIHVQTGMRVTISDCAAQER